MASHGTFAEYVAAHPDSRLLLDDVRAALAPLGTFDERSSTSQLAFRTGGRTVAIVWAPGQYLHGDVAPLVLTLVFPTADPSTRWKEVVPVDPHHVTHHLELFHSEDLDDEVRAWLHRACGSPG